MNLITAQEFSEFRSDISKGWAKEKDKIDRCIDEAQSVDLYDVLNQFYFDLIDNKDTAEWQDLFNGSTFTYQGRTYMHKGIKNYLAGLSYVRYLFLSNTTHTPHGFVSKMNDNSEPVNWNQTRDIRKDVQKTNEIEFKRIDLYLRSQPELFENYCKGNNPDINTFSYKTSTLR